METEIIQKIQQILYYIEEYENGNEDYYDAIIEIIKAIKKYRKTAKKNYLRTSFILFVSKIATTITASCLKEEDYYQKLINASSIDLEYYLESSKVLESYVNKCLETNTFPDLEAAYILTIKLSLILDNIMNYLREIRMLEKSAIKEFYYISSDRVIENSESNKKEVEELIKVLKLGGQENVPCN